ncbi:M16 family metallopeptidase [Reyranella sp.]|uniref:M16 family metallopeptidase n=1 Tax=Reyranella sp. TaxID=1929291 RepID=UPI003D0BDF0C
MRRRTALGGLFAGALLTPRASALAGLLRVNRRPSDTFTLPNGLQAVVLPSSRAPIVTQVLVYKVGSADETFGKTGIAHFLEHMMFKGTGVLAPTEFSRTIARNGGRDNAFTGFDMTGYHQTIVSDRLELVMRMEADRMVNLRILDGELRPERQVVLEERRMRVDNVPSEMLDEAVREQLFGLHKPYAMPTAGYADDVKKLGVNDLSAFYRRFYAPNNAVLIVAGDTTAAAVQKLAEKYYGPIPSRRVAPRQRPAEGGTDLPQRVIRADERVPEPRWNRDYLAPSYRTGETRHAHALMVLTRLFGGSETSRLSRALVAQDKIALSATSGYGPTALGLTTFEIAVQPARGRSVAEVETAVGDQMKRVLDGGVTAEEVERAQNQLLASAIYSQDSLASGPRLYGNALSTGGSIAELDNWPQAIAAVRPDDVVAAARHVWRDEGAVTSMLTPAGGWK